MIFAFPQYVLFRRKASFEPGADMRKGSKEDRQKSEDTGSPRRPFSLQPKLGWYLGSSAVAMQQKFAIKGHGE